MSVESITLITAVIGAACGITGTVLGVTNTWHQLQRNRLHLKVIPKRVMLVGAAKTVPANFSIEVINLSEFAVVISDVGFLLDEGSRATLASVQGLEPNGPLPLRLEPRTSYSKCFLLDRNTAPLSAITTAYAQTECGSTVPGTSPVLKNLIRRGRQAGTDGVRDEVAESQETQR